MRQFFAVFRVLVVLLGLSLLGIPGILAGPRLDAPEPSEEEQIQQRLEWFFSSRRQGTAPQADLSSLRLSGVQATKNLMAQQKIRRSFGFEADQNFWVSKGPSPSTFGNWSFGNVSGRIQAIAADWAGGTLYAGAGGGGVWKSTNDGLTWESIFDSAGTMAVGAVTVDPSNPDVLWVGTGDNVSSCESYFGIGLLRSGDGGATWEMRNGSGSNSLQGLASFASVIVDPRDSNHLIVGGRYSNCVDGSQDDGGIFTSNDGGLTWTLRLFSEQIHEIAQDPAVLDTYWACSRTGILKSTDNGVTWMLQTASGLPAGNVGRAEIAIAPSNPMVVYALFSSGPEFWRTTNGGTSWTQMSSGTNACDGQCTYNMTLRVDPFDSDTVYRGTIRIFRSENGGSSWSDLSNGWGSNQTVHQDTHALLMDPNNPGSFYVSGDGGLWKSENAGDTFSNLNGNLNITQFYAIGVDAADPERICGGAQDNSSLARDTDDVWDRQAVTGDGFVCAIDPFDTNWAYITSYPSGGYPNIWRSSGGLFGSFQDITGTGSGINSGDRINWVTPYTLDPVNPNVLYLGTHRVYRTTNRGSGWTQVGPDLTGGSGSLRVIEVNRNFPTHLFSGSTSGKVWRSTNSGTDWIDITTGLPGRAINDVAGDPTNPDRAFAVVGGFNTSHVWEWNAGAGWTEHAGNLPNVPANSVVMLSGLDIMVGIDTGVFRSYDGGQTFTPYMNGLPEGLVVMDLKYNPLQHVMTAGTYGRGAWQVELGPLTPSVIFDSIQQPLIEQDGDGDAHLEPGETWAIVPLLRNAGGQAALGVSARLSSSTPGVTILDETGQYGDIEPGQAVVAQAAHRFTIDPSFVCGTELAFDVVEVVSVNEPQSHADRPNAFNALVVDATETPITTTPLDEGFDPAPSGGWSHEAGDEDLPECSGTPHSDEWNLRSKDGAHGTSFHAGRGPDESYPRSVLAWLYPFGKDSESGPGLTIPADVTAATLTLEHWYETPATEDGGQLAVDAIDDGQDTYITLSPVGGYPGSVLTDNLCNALGGQEAFHGSSGGWITSEFNLMPYAGSQIHLAFVFGSDKKPSGGEGWYIDNVTVAYQQPGPPICHVARWPGTVSDAQFELDGGGSIQASWSDACNIAGFPGQTYSIQTGDLDLLSSAGTYSHAVLDGRCDRLSADSISPGSGNEYYLIVPEGDGREGGAGTDSSGVTRPQVDPECGAQRIACP